MVLRYLLILALAIAPVRFLGAMPTMDHQVEAYSVQSPLDGAGHCKMMESGGKAQVADIDHEAASSDCDCCDTVCDCPSCGQGCHVASSVSLLNSTSSAMIGDSRVMQAYPEASMHGILPSPVEIPPIH